jgi:lysyl-tRNA synthetase class 2
MIAADWRPSATPTVLRRRAAMLAAARDYFARSAVIEVDTPLLSHCAASDPHLESVAAEVAGQGRMYLHTSPEFAMKRLLAAGLGDCYQICHVFRDGERGAQHNPEFTMIEWYRVGFDAVQLMDEVEALLGDMLAGLRSLPPAERIAYRDAVREVAGADPMTATAAELAATLGRHGVGVPASSRGERDALLDLVVSAVVGPRLGAGRPAFIHGYPASQAALARIRPDDPALADRFELYVDGVELANGFHELGDGIEQRRRFEADLATRAALGRPSRPVDRRLLGALDHGLPDCSGVALGFDRLVMIALRLGAIDAAMPFAVERA